jgi:GNAT superfamily N-acetyltransferase
MSGSLVHDLTIVRCAPEEVEPLHAIVAECGKDMKRRFNLAHWDPPYPLETMRRHAAEINVYGVRCKTPGRDDELVGTFTAGSHGWKYDDRLWADPSQPAFYLGKLAVRPCYQGQGIGRWCMQRVESLARVSNCTTVRFDAIAAHIKLILFYKNLGYLERGTRLITDWRGLEWEIVYLEKCLEAAGG